jgi:cell division protein FtsN
MGRDYAARNRRPAARAAGLPGWVWLVAGLSMGLVVACIVYIGRPTQPMPMAPAGGAGGDGGERKIAKTKVEIPPVEEPRFDFYTLLEKEQVVVPGESRPRPPTQKPARPIAPPSPPSPVPNGGVAAVTPGTIAPVPATSPPGATRYLVLAGSFKESANAEAHRAKLALVGVEARIETVGTQDGVTLHRVRIGPANSLEQAESIASRLKGQGFDSRVVKMP